MNEVKLTDFDKETLSDVAATISLRIDKIENSSYKRVPAAIKRKDKLIEFRTQVLYAFSIVKERSKITES